MGELIVFEQIKGITRNAATESHPSNPCSVTSQSGSSYRPQAATPSGGGRELICLTIRMGIHLIPSSGVLISAAARSGIASAGDSALGARTRCSLRCATEEPERLPLDRVVLGVLKLGAEGSRPTYHLVSREKPLVAPATQLLVERLIGSDRVRDVPGVNERVDFHVHGEEAPEGRRTIWAAHDRVQGALARCRIECCVARSRPVPTSIARPGDVCAERDSDAHIVVDDVVGDVACGPSLAWRGCVPCPVRIRSVDCCGQPSSCPTQASENVTHSHSSS